MKKYVYVIAMLTMGAVFAQDNETTARLTKQVRHELVTLPYLTVFDDLAFRIDGDSVTLFGSVTRPILKSDAQNVVRRIEGVKRVDNQITVLPPSPNDDRLRHALYRAIYGYPALNRYAMPVLKPIRIIVNNGNVTLEGVVDTQTDKNIVNIRANGVHGVFSVTNNLRVGETTTSSLPRLAPGSAERN
jgi:hyperosmotically inducible protein